MNKKATIIGYIKLVDENDEDKGLILSTEDEDYFLLSNKKSEELMDMVGVEVQVRGILSEDREGNYQILVSSYDNLEDDDDYGYDDDYDYSYGYRHNDYYEEDEDY